MRILLIFPPALATDRTTEFISVGQPLGIAYLGAQLELAGHEVVLLDAFIGGFVPDITCNQIDDSNRDHYIRVSNGVAKRNALHEGFPIGSFSVGMSLDEIQEKVREIQPDVVGISIIFTSVYRLGLKIAERVKAVNPSIFTVLGGSHITVSPNEALEHKCIDFIVLGEAERSLPHLLLAIEKHKLPFGIPGTGFRDPYTGDVIIHQPDLLYDLDNTPMPAFHLLPMEDYFKYAAEGRIIKMYTSRGCTFNCSFCSVPATSQRRFRSHSPERIIQEIEHLISAYGVTGIMFEDDNMNLNPKRYQRIMELLVQGEYGLNLYARNFRCDILSRPTLNLMRKAGFSEVWITPESGSQRVLDEVIGKRMRLANVTASVQRIISEGMRVGAAFVIGMPGETWEEIEETTAYATYLKTLGVTNFWFSIATPIEGTRMYKAAKNQGIINGMDLDNFSYNRATINTSEFSAIRIEELREQLMLELNSYGV
jgi:radical SAM superfamily enzyme YgiQ (UPF0313 family)